MLSPIPHSALQALAALLHERAGLRIAQDGFRSLRWALGERMPATGATDADLYVRGLRGPGGEAELRALLPHVTVTHSEFFRDPRQFQALERRVLPELLAHARAEARPLRIWSAGCATGEEPYSVAMALDEQGAEACELDLWATDLNQTALETARGARFAPRRLLHVSPSRRARYFQADPTGESFELCEPIRSRVRFEVHNLAAPAAAPSASGGFDLILCRNVIIYFDPLVIRGVLDRFFDALRPGGVLVLGYSESLFRVYDRFEMLEVEGAFLYRRPQAAPPTPQPPTPRSMPIPLASPPVRAPSAPCSPPDRVQRSAALAQAGHFDEAMDALQTLLRDHPMHLAARLSLGNLCSLSGRLEDAEAIFTGALREDPLCVDARLYRALAQLQAGRHEKAREELQKVLFLEPTLALAHYLFAQVNERLGEVGAAKRAYRNVLSQVHVAQRPLAGFYPELPTSPEPVFRAAGHALAALEAD